MRIVTKITAGLLLLAAVGCREMPTVTVGGGRTLAKAGGATLDEQELGRALPAGLTGDDSVAFAELYVRKWIGKQLKLSEAEQLFSASADDIEAKVEAYRQSLLIRKLDQFYVDERIDTTFTEEDIAAYYNAHKAEFKLDRPLVKGRIVRFPVNHRQSFKLRELVKASSTDRLQDLADICAKNDFELKEFAGVDAVERFCGQPAAASGNGVGAVDPTGRGAAVARQRVALLFLCDGGGRQRPDGAARNAPGHHSPYPVQPAAGRGDPFARGGAGRRGAGGRRGENLREQEQLDFIDFTI